MLVSCSYCGHRHKRGEICKNKPKDNRKKEETSIRRFRSSTLWKRKREQIKQRDKRLCQVCLSKDRYTFQQLEVHHITPLSKNWRLRLEDNNLITLCRTCHDMADNGNINRKTLAQLVKNEDAQKSL